MSDLLTVAVALGARSYDVRIGSGLLASLGPMLQGMGARRAAIVTDRLVAEHWLAPARTSLAEAGVACSEVLVAPGEASKTFSVLEEVCEALLRAGLERQDLVVALGGGVIGDLAGFAAGVLKRGLDFVQVPTSLLAQVDSSVGGKTGINSRAGKNLIGLFHQPRLVLADIATLATLPARELRAGFAEVIKYGLIDAPDFFGWCEANATAALAGEPNILATAVAQSVAAKARVVAMDERENGQRALLNLGHTFGHALEVAAGYDGRLLHGEAVATGMALAFRFSVQLGFCPAEDCARVEALLARCDFASRLRDCPGGPFSADTLLAAMDHDKKNEGGALTLILARGIGKAFIQKAVSRERLHALLQQELAPT